MNIDKFHIASQKPKIYEKGDSIMWTDGHISKKLLEIHLNPDIDSASRMPESISRTVEFIKTFYTESSMSILDLGCGPGIYMGKLAQLGHACTGIDFSKNSISYAKKRAKEKGLEINYICQDYLEQKFQEQQTWTFEYSGFWTQYFNPEDVIALLSARRFRLTESFENTLPVSDIWNGENVTFFKTQK